MPKLRRRTMKFKLVSYEAPEGSVKAQTLLLETQKVLDELISALGGRLVKEEIKLMEGEQSGMHKVFVLFPIENPQIEEELNKASGQVWNPSFQSTKMVDVILDLRGNGPSSEESTPEAAQKGRCK
jgi:hypothetical protein